MFYTDLGINTAPFSLNFDDSIGKRQHLYYRNNSRPTIGLGFSYKWFSLRVAFNVLSHVHPVSAYGKTIYYDLGFEFKTKRHFYDVDLHNYTGYAIKNADSWNDSLAENNIRHYISKNTNAFSLSLNAWRFRNKNIQFSAIRGKTGLYLKEQKSIYIKTTFNYFGVTNPYFPVIPSEIQNPSNSKLNSRHFNALDFGILPGYVYVNRIHNWQFSAMGGFGPVIQLKEYNADDKTRMFLGLAPRFDIRLLAGYNVPKWFLMLLTEFDNKSIRFSDLSYRQTFYMVRLVGGMRIG